MGGVEVPTTTAAVAAATKAGSVVVNISATWCEPCAHLNTVFAELAAQHAALRFVQIDADELPEVCEQYSVESVPAFLFLHAGALVDSVMGADAPALTAKAQQHATTAAIHTDAAPASGAAAAAAGAAGVDVGGAKEPLDARLKKLTAQSPVMLFMKGSPDAPRCGFSRQIVEILQAEKVAFGHFDILTDEEVRQGLKTYSNWPTYPQLYAEGSLIGGLDIVKEMKEDGELKAALPATATAEPLDARLKKLTAQSPVMLFMKGSPDAPRCGFSRQIVEILQAEKVAFGHFDILTDEEVRQGLKTYSNWPTYPQLYAEGSLIGGLDIVKEMKEDGELKAALPKAALPAAEHEHGHAEEHGHEHDGCCGHEKKAGCCGEDHGHHDHGHA